MYVGLISDTHGIFSEEFKEFLAPVDEIWHAGDFGGGLEFTDKIKEFKPLRGVFGNADGQDIRLEFPEYLSFEVEGLKFLMIHIGGYPGHYSTRSRALVDEMKPDVFICGHSHILKVMRDQKRNMICINPGAAGLQGWHIVRTALRFKVENGELSEMEVFELQRGKKY